MCVRVCVRVCVCVCVCECVCVCVCVCVLTRKMTSSVSKSPFIDVKFLYCQSYSAYEAGALVVDGESCD